MPKKETRGKKSKVEQKLKGVDIPQELFDHIAAMMDADEESVIQVDENSGRKISAFDTSFGNLVLSAKIRELDELLSAIAQRQMESLNLFAPMKDQKRFLDSKAFIRLLLGGNRSGKTLTTHVELARILTSQKKGFRASGDMYLVGKDLQHIGAVCWKKLTSWGPFQMIRDPATNHWRPFSFENKWDVENKHLRRPAPPLIPPRFYGEDDIAWEEKKSRIPKGCHFHSSGPKGEDQNWHLTCLSSKASPPQGYDCDVGAFDEEIIGDEWFPEMIRGLTDREGIFIWGATAQKSTEMLLELYERGTKKGDKDVEAFVLDTMNNNFVSEEGRNRFARSLSPAQRRVRLHGGFAIDNVRVYPELNVSEEHGVDAHTIPIDWTIYVAVDPGVQRLAILFAAIAPEDNHVEIFNEVYLERGTAAKFGRAMKRILGDRVPETIIIDHRMGRQSQMGSGESVEWHYSQELKKQRIRSRRNGYGFQWGSTDIPGREASLQKWLRIRGNGMCRLKIHKSKCPNLEWEMAKQRYKNDDGQSKRVDKDNHLVTCLEYLAASKPKWVQPVAPKKKTPAIITLKKKMDAFFATSKDSEASTRMGPRGDRRRGSTSATK